MILNGEICQASSDFISVEDEQSFEKTLQKSDIKEYCKYVTYKIAHFMEIFHATRVLEMNTEWLQDDLCQFYFMNVSNLKVTECYRQCISNELF